MFYLKTAPLLKQYKTYLFKNADGGTYRYDEETDVWLLTAPDGTEMEIGAKNISDAPGRRKISLTGLPEVLDVLYNDSYSSLFTFTEVLDYPNKVTLAQIDPAKDELIYGIEGKIGTFSAPYATVLPDDVTAYYAQKTDMNGTNVLHLTPLNATTQGIPANQGVILVGGANAESKVRMIPATSEWVESIGNNAFFNTAAGSVDMQTGDYVLARGEQGIGFYQATGTLKPNKAYLSLDNISNVSAFRLVFGETTDLNSSVTIINPNAPIYDLSGRRVMQTVKGGVYIQNGKKFIVK